MGMQYAMGLGEKFVHGAVQEGFRRRFAGIINWIPGGIYLQKVFFGKVALVQATLGYKKITLPGLPVRVIGRRGWCPAFLEQKVHGFGPFGGLPDRFLE